MNSNKNWVLEIDPGVLRSLKKIPRNDAAKILKVIEVLMLNPYFGDIQKLGGVDNTWRRRVGSYRIFYKLISSRNTILVFHVERRTSGTY